MRAALRRRRDRHGRGLRHELLPANLPAYRTRAQRFDDLVLDGVEALEERWARELEDVEFAVEDVPPELPSGDEGGDPVPLARLEPAAGPAPPRVVVYRRPLEARAHDRLDLADLVFDVLVHEVAHLLGVEPEVIDPEGHLPEE
ncbi:MAG: metallopeptidase family protein [Mycobacteriales bacterium]